MQVSAVARAVTFLGMLRKLLWTGLYGVLSAVSAIAARRLATRLWRVLTGEPPPVKQK